MKVTLSWVCCCVRTRLLSKHNRVRKKKTIFHEIKLSKNCPNDGNISSVLCVFEVFFLVCATDFRRSFVLYERTIDSSMQAPFLCQVKKGFVTFCC